MSTDRPRRLPIALVLLGCAGPLYLAFSLAWQSLLPSDGTLLTEFSSSGTSVAIILSPSPNGLQVGDQVLDLDGRTVWKYVNSALEGGPPAGPEIGQPVTYHVLRAGKPVDVPVTLQRFPVGRLLLLRPGVYLLVLATLLVGSYILLARPHEPAARLLFILAISLSLPLALPFHVAHLLVPALFLADTVVKALAMSLIFSGVLHLFLTFPVVKPRLRGRERGLLGLHVLNPRYLALDRAAGR